jgi:transposase-like protein
VDELVISLSAKGLTTGEVQAHLAEVYGADVSRQTISTITEKVVEGMAEWQNRPLDPGRCIRLCSSTRSTSRSATGWSPTGPSTSRSRSPARAAATSSGSGPGRPPRSPAAPVGEGAKYWLHVLTEIKNRGVGDVLMVVCDGLTGLPDAISTVWPQAITQTCAVYYADLRIMPTRPWSPLRRTGLWIMRSA